MHMPCTNTTHPAAGRLAMAAIVGGALAVGVPALYAADALARCITAVRTAGGRRA